MKQEEKLEEAKRLYQAANADQRYVLESLFPELKELGDERVRKELIDYINRLTVTPNNIDRYNSWVNWLEKQAPKPKWSEGDDAYKLFAISAVEDYYDGGNPLRKDIVAWLNSLEQRLGGEK